MIASGNDLRYNKSAESPKPDRLFENLLMHEGLAQFLAVPEAGFQRNAESGAYISPWAFLRQQAIADLPRAASPFHFPQLVSELLLTGEFGGGVESGRRGFGFAGFPA